MKHTNERNITLYSAGFAATAVMLTLAQAPIGLWPLAWVAYVPFILVCSRFEKTTPDPFFLIAYIVGAGFWLGNIYWMSYVTVAGWISFCLYTAILWPILAMTVRWCRSKRIPLFLSVPILVVGIEQSQGFLLGGFNWLYLGHSQYANTTLIQIADIFGATGISFLVAMVNGLIAEWALSIRGGRPPINWGAKFTTSAFVIAAVAGTLIYGNWRIGQAEGCVKAGPIVAAVQTNVPQSVKQSFAAEEEIFEELLGQSKQCIPAGAKLVVWPETMVQAVLNRQIWPYLQAPEKNEAFDKAIREHSRETAYVLVGAYDIQPTERKGKEDNWGNYNTAFLYRPDGNQAPEKYYKIHLVPFGEFIPFTNIPVIHNLLLKMTPYDFDYTLEAGTEYTAFEMNAEANATNKFGVIICYEDAVPYVVRRFALDGEGHKRIDWLVNISNDGWFVKFEDNKVITSTEQSQHTAICAFRAVENRLAVVRSVNTGISCMIDTLGRIRDGYAAGNLPAKAFDRRGVAGWFADRVPIDPRITFFSKYGQWLDFSCQLCLAGIIIIQVAEKFIFRKQIKKEAIKK